MKALRCLGLVAIIGASSSCSGIMEVQACMMQGRLAFALGDVPGLLWGKSTPVPHRISVNDPAYFGEPHSVRWLAEHHAQIKPEARARSLILYGERLEGFRLDHAPEALVRGRKYVVHVNAGPDFGVEEFTFSPKLPTCAAVKFPA